MGVIGAIIGPSKNTPTAAPPGQSSPEAASTVAATPEDALEASIKAKLGDSNRDVTPRVSKFTTDRKVIVVQWAGNDNLSKDLIASGMQIDATDVLRLITESAVKYKTVQLQITFSMVDKKGNESEDIVVRANYSKSELDDVKWDNFLRTNVWDIADGAMIHPEFQQADG